MYNCNYPPTCRVFALGLLTKKLPRNAGKNKKEAQAKRQQRERTMQQQEVASQQREVLLNDRRQRDQEAFKAARQGEVTSTPRSRVPNHRNSFLDLDQN
jgi:hypothetical protein